MIPELFTAVAVWGLVCVGIASFRPRLSITGLTTTIIGMATAELARFHIAWQVPTTAAWIAFGALGEPIGFVGLGAAVLGWAGLELAHRRGHRARAVVRAALAPAGIDMPETVADRARFHHPLRPPFAGVTITRDLPYGPETRNRADLFVPDGVGPERGGRGAPMVLQIHGGGWVIGRKDQQGQPLLSHFTSQGWIGVAINYRMGPRHRLPAAVHDVKRAIAWTRANAAEWGGDADRILVTGGSAGGHLTALAALTIGDASLQPGFEDLDCSVAAAAPVYGVFDLTDSGRHRGRSAMTPFLQRLVMGTKLADDADGWNGLSPIFRLHADAPPMLVIGAAFDTLVPIEETREFVARLRDTTGDSLSIELPHAHHAFDVIGSPRTMHVVEGMERWAAVATAGGPVDA